jgi:hypothetical protein
MVTGVAAKLRAVEDFIQIGLEIGIFHQPWVLAGVRHQVPRHHHCRGGQAILGIKETGIQAGQGAVATSTNLGQDPIHGR